jgi:1,4-dihydroxy-2-naphthoyl-CoA synthase
MSVAISLAENIVSSDPLPIRCMKNRFLKTYGMPIHSGLRLDAGPDPYSSEDAKEGAKAFLEKRTLV